MKNQAPHQHTADCKHTEPEVKPKEYDAIATLIDGLSRATGNLATAPHWDLLVADNGLFAVLTVACSGCVNTLETGYKMMTKSNKRRRVFKTTAMTAAEVNIAVAPPPATKTAVREARKAAEGAFTRASVLTIVDTALAAAHAVCPRIENWSITLETREKRNGPVEHLTLTPESPISGAEQAAVASQVQGAVFELWGPENYPDVTLVVERTKTSFCGCDYRDPVEAP